jgi:hypothetical protein
MKAFLGVLIVLAMVSPLFADITLFSEGFEGAAASTHVIGYNGWTNSNVDDSLLISGTTIDSGQSASGGAWEKASKTFTPTAGTGETWTLTATLLAADTSGAYAHLLLRNHAATYGTNGYQNSYNIPLGYAWTNASLLNSTGNDFVGALTNSGQATTPVDVKFVFSQNAQQFSFKKHSDTAWTDGGSATWSGPALNTFDTVTLIANAGGGNGYDSILLTSNAPEPSSLVLAGMGLLGLLAYAWRKRK